MTTKNQSPSSLAELILPDEGSIQIPVSISYEIIRLFSEGLYQSPHKAIEELVSNSFDAGAGTVRVLMPRPPEDAGGYNDSLWVFDDGTGMDGDGFSLLWRVADSHKSDLLAGPRDRPPIGQFGIGKLAAYVLAWRLTHVSKTAGIFRYTSMDFTKVSGVHQWDADSEPVKIALHEITETATRELLGEIRDRSPDTWNMMFGDKAADSWTAAALTDFKDLFGKLREGTLGWVLRTGLPLQSDFQIFLNDEQLEPSKSDLPTILEIKVGGPKDPEADKLGIAHTQTGITIPEISGEISGVAQLFARPLTGGKSATTRSHGFFVRVRGRVINLQDELFGIEALNHAAWAHFSMSIDADGLRDHLLSSREGVRNSQPVYLLREYLHLKFNACRLAYEKQLATDLAGIDIQQLLSQAPSSLVTEPLLHAVSDGIRSGDAGLYYIATPHGLPESAQVEWLGRYEKDVQEQPFSEVDHSPVGPYDRLATYDADTRALHVNDDHPYISTISAHAKSRAPATMVATSEVLSDALLTTLGVDSATRLAYFEQHDRALRVIAGEQGPDPVQAIRRLAIANVDETAFERAVGEGFSVLGLEYEVRGSNKGGTDGVLTARLGLTSGGVADYKVVYDGKTTNAASVPVDKVNVGALQDFAKQEKADHAFVIAKRFDGQSSDQSALSRRVWNEDGSQEKATVTALTTECLQRIIRLHYRYGVTLTRLRGLFVSCRTVMASAAWVEALERDLSQKSSHVPLKRLLEGLETAKSDPKSAPNIRAVRATDARLKDFEPDQLIASLSALQTVVGDSWLSVDRRNGDVRLHHNATQILLEVNRKLTDELMLEPLPDDQ